MNKLDNLTMMAKGFSIMLAGAITWISSNVIALIEPPSSNWMLWLDKYGFPTVVSILFLIGIVVIFKAYCSVQESRISDRDHSIEQFRQDFTEAQTSRLELVQTNRQTVEMLGQVKAELQAMQGFRINRKASKIANPPSTDKPANETQSN